MRGTLKLVVVASSAAIATATMVSESTARARLNFFFAPYYQPGYQAYIEPPAYAPPPRYYYYYDEYPRNPAVYDFEDEYYEPQYEPEARPLKKQTAKPAKAAVAPAAKKTAEVLSCSKATKVVSGFGFSDVKSVDCKGQVYAFNAVRDGKKFAIKFNAVNGELTEVKKL